MKKFILPLYFFLITSHVNAADIDFRISNLRSDTLHIFWVLDEAVGQTRKEQVTIQNGLAHWTPQLTEACVVRISDGQHFIYAIIEPTDSVHINYNAEDIITTLNSAGRGYGKYFPDIRKATSARIALLTKSITVNNLEQGWQNVNLLHQQLSDSLAHCHTRTRILNVVKASYAAVFNYSRRRLLAKLYPNEGLLMIANRPELSSYLQQEIRKLLKFEDAFYESPEYLNDVYYTLLQEYMTLKLGQHVAGDIENKYSFYSRYLKYPHLRARILYMLAETDFKSLTDSGFLTAWLQKEFSTFDIQYVAHFRNLIDRYGQLFRKGEKAPEFVLSDSSGKAVRLSDLLGKVVVLDFWYRSCAPCLALFQQLAPIKDSLAYQPVIFLTISIDERQTWIQALQQLNLQGYHLYTQDLKDRHPVIEAYQVNGYPTVCIIDGRGNIFNAAPPVGSSSALLAQIRAALVEK